MLERSAKPGAPGKDEAATCVTGVSPARAICGTGETPVIPFASCFPLVSFVISTYNRRIVLLQTLAHIEQCGLARDRFEILVVDNASPDGTAEAVARTFPNVRVFALLRNRGSCAKNIAIGHARGQYIVFLDDDSYPLPGAVAQMIRHFEKDARLGAVVFAITLPDGSRECSAYPDVFIGCGTGFRRQAMDEVGLLPEEFFMQAEEYDLSLRLLQGGWDIRAFDDLHVNHMKTPSARRSWRTTRLDVRNNFLVAMRYMPRPWLKEFTIDWMRRYYDIAKSKNQTSAFVVGIFQGIVGSLALHKRRPVNAEVFEQFTRMRQIEQRLAHAKVQFALRTVLLVDYGKNILPYWIAARKLGLEVVAVADNRMAGARLYRGVPIVKDSIAKQLEFDAAIVSNSSRVHAAARAKTWRMMDQRPVIDLLDARFGFIAAPSAQQTISLAA